MPERVGDLAIVLHSHMPYVEGFGTYPFGEEWLFDAVIRSYLPLLEEVRGLTLTVTPVLADQLEVRDVGERLRRFLVVHRLQAAEADADSVGPEHREAARAEFER
jgi:1,4-alpha-glucan branching enzyme